MNKIDILLLTALVCSTGYGQTVTDTAGPYSKTDSGNLTRNSGWITVKSDPNGAEVYDGSLFLGVTPLDSISVKEGIHIIKLFHPSARTWNSLSSVDTIAVVSSQERTCLIQFGETAGPRILKHEGNSQERDPNLFIASSHKENNKALAGYAAGATMILAGTLSAYLKTTSDNYFDTYVVNRDPNLLARVHRLDTWAGVSLFISEVSFGFLIYLLLSE